MTQVRSLMGGSLFAGPRFSRRAEIHPSWDVDQLAANRAGGPDNTTGGWSRWDDQRPDSGSDPDSPYGEVNDYTGRTIQ